MKPATLLGAALGLSLLAAPVPSAEAPEAGVLSHLTRANELLLAEHPTHAQMRQGFLHLLDASLTVAPQGATAGWPGKATEARRLVEEGSIVDPRAAALLKQCYRETHGGEEFRMPPAVRTIADAREQIQIWLAAVPDLVEAGNSEEAAQRLLEAAVAIVTPMQR
jgi:hypothetical protein